MGLIYIRISKKTIIYYFYINNKIVLIKGDKTMKEITVKNVAVQELEGFYKDTIIEFAFDGIDGRYSCNEMNGETLREVSYALLYANWNTVEGYPNHFPQTVYPEFMEAFKAKFGIEIPTV